MSTNIVSGSIEPGFGGNFAVGCGFNLKDWRFGSSITWTVEEPVKIVEPSQTILGGLERYATTALTVSLTSSDEWTETLNYTDQTWFGSPLNTSLGKGLAFQVQRRWLR